MDSERAEGDYARVRRRALFRDILARLTRRDNRLLSYDEVKQSLRLGGPVYRGTQLVPVKQIVGSVDRYRDFDREFLPVQDHTAAKWKGIARAFYHDVNLPPVKLYKVGDAYFVLDGHHRVSVAREQGIEHIEAEVKEAYSRVPVTADLEAEDLKVLHEYRNFLERTRLDEIRPQARPIRLTIAGGYDELLEHIAVHRYFMGRDLHRDVSGEEAVGHWYDTVYQPIVEEIRRQNLLEKFPSRTEADLYLWIVSHLFYLRVLEGDADVGEAVADFADPLTRRRQHKIEQVARDAQRLLENEESEDSAEDESDKKEA
jgi:hypothetical protein